MIDNSPIPADAKFRQIIVPTVDTVRYGYLLDKTLRNGSPLLVVGPTGTGEGELQGGGMGGGVFALLVAGHAGTCKGEQRGGGCSGGGHLPHHSFIIALSRQTRL